MSNERPKRRLPRFWLMTLIVAVNVAGVLVWANVTGYERDVRRRLSMGSSPIRKLEPCEYPF